MFGKEVAERVPGMIRSLCLIWVSLFTFGVLTITRYEQKTNTAEKVKNTSDDDTNFGPIQSDEEKKAEQEAQISEILKSPKFIFLYLIASSHLFQGYYIGNSFK